MGVHEREREVAYQVEQLGRLWRLWRSEVAVAEHLVEVLRNPTPPRAAARSGPGPTSDSFEDTLARQRGRLAELRCLWDDPLALAHQLVELQLNKDCSDRSRAAEIRELGWPIPLVPQAQPAPLQLAAAVMSNRADRSPRPDSAGSRAGLPTSNGRRGAPTRREGELPRRWRLRASLAVLMMLGVVALLLDLAPIDPFGSPGVASWSPPALLSVFLAALAVILLVPPGRPSGRRRREGDHGD